MAEVNRRWTPYQYCYNNPIIYVDPDGMLATLVDGNLTLTGDHAKGFLIGLQIGLADGEDNIDLTFVSPLRTMFVAIISSLLGNSEGGGGSSVGGDADCPSLYGLYRTMDAAAFGWSRLFNYSGKGVEYSGIIYSVNTNDGPMYGFTRGVRFPDKVKKTDRDPTVRSPGPDDPAHIATLPPGATPVGYIHTHIKGSANRDFSPDYRYEKHDEYLFTKFSDKTFYLINDIGDLRVRRPGQRYDGNWFSGKIGEDFYGGNGYAERINGKQVNYGDIPSPYWRKNSNEERSFLDSEIKSVTDTYPVRYIDFCGNQFDKNQKPIVPKGF